MFRTKVNDSARTMMAEIKTWYDDPEWVQPLYGFAVTVDSYNTLRIAAVNGTGHCTAGRRVRLSGGASTVYGTIVSSSFPDPDTTININIDPSLGRDALYDGAAAEFHDDNPDRITAPGTPFAGIVTNDRVRVEKSPTNNGTYRVGSLPAGGNIILEASETLNAEGPGNGAVYHEYGIIPAGTSQISLYHSRSVRDSAFRDVGVDASDIPSMSHLKAHVLKDEGSGGGIDADTLDGFHYNELLALLAPRENMLINSEFRRWQEGSSMAPIPDAAYCADQWKVLSGLTNAVDVARTEVEAETPTTAKFGIKITQAIADEDWMLYQMVESRDAIPARGKSLSLSFQAMLASGDTSPSRLRFGIVESTGTADTLYSTAPDPISSWPVAGSDPVFTLPPTYSLAGSDGEDLVAGSWVECKLENIAIDATANNVGVMIWTDDDTIGVGDIVFISQVKLEIGEAAGAYVPEREVDVIAQTDRFFCKTFMEGDAPPGPHGKQGAVRCKGSNAVTAGNQVGITWFYPERMVRVSGAITYSPQDGTAGQWHEYVAGTNETATAFNESDHSVDLGASSASTSPWGDWYVHVKVNARIF